jgi:hypothetical protein
LAGTVALAAEAPRTPVLVELFTSEGCSSCPPADSLLEKLDQLQPLPGIEVIVLSEHVDYWNHIGWTDPFSSRAFSERQEQYARRFRISGPYTPQMVVDGAAEFVGNDGRAAQDAIRSAAKQPKIGVRFIPAPAGGHTVRLEVDPLPAGGKAKSPVYVALADNSATSDVRRGENQGRTLHHVAIVRQLRQAGTVTGREGFTTALELPAGSRLVAFVQDNFGQVRGAALVIAPGHPL